MGEFRAVGIQPLRGRAQPDALLQFASSMVNPNKNPQQAHPVTLGSAVGTGSLIAVALGVAVFAGFEYLLTPDVQFSEFILHHVLPGILVGIAVSVTISIVLRREADLLSGAQNTRSAG